MGWDRPILTDSGGLPGDEPGGTGAGRRRRRALPVARRRPARPAPARGRRRRSGSARRRRRHVARRVRARRRVAGCRRPGRRPDHRVGRARAGGAPAHRHGALRHRPGRDSIRRSARPARRRCSRCRFDGYAVGGLSVGEPPAETARVAAETVGLLPAARPRYLMGMGTPRDLLTFAGLGYDLFDCVLPTRNARNGMLFTREGSLMIRNARHARDPRPVDEACACYTCRHFSRGALRHLALAKEMLGAQLATLHNLHFYLALMREIRADLAAGTFPQRAEWPRAPGPERGNRLGADRRGERPAAALQHRVHRPDVRHLLLRPAAAGAAATARSTTSCSPASSATIRW